jgi:peptidoglycan/LPS O-acetylase OafA/YrhL
LGPRLKAGLANRLAFADLLRGLAALAVVIGHYSILYLTEPHIISAVTLGEPTRAVPVPEGLASILSWFNFPAIGVAVFFLISGFVIPLSLEGTDTRAYFLKRFLRIFPTYWIALGIGVAALFVSAFYWSKPVPITTLDYIGNALLLSNALSYTRSDILSVAWTLQIEIKFYLLAPFIYMALKRGLLLPVLLCGLAVLGVYWNATALCDGVHIACWDHYRFGVRMLWFDAMFMVFMLIGSLFYAQYRKLLRSWQVIAGVIFLVGCYQAAVSAAPLPELATDRRVPYLWGLAIFACLYFMRDSVTLTRPFRFLADISYSLYLVHPLFGYVTMRLLMAHGAPYIVALPVALSLVIGLATIMYLYVEAPLIAFGKRFSKAWFGARKNGKVVVPEAAQALDLPAFHA